MRNSNFIDLTTPRTDTLGRVYKNNRIIVHAGDLIKAHSGIYNVVQVDYKVDGTFVKILKSMNRVSDGRNHYLIVEMSELHNIDNLVKDAMSSSTVGANNPVNAGKEDDEEVEKAGSGGMTNAEEGIVDPVGLAEKKRREINDKLGVTLEHTKGVVLPEILANPPRQLVTKNLNSFDVDLPFGLKYVTNKAISEEDSTPKKKDQVEDKEEPDIEDAREAGRATDPEDKFGDDKKKDSEGFTGEEQPEEGHSLEPVPDPTANLAPNYNKYLYPFGKEEEQRAPIKKEGQKDEEGVSEDTFSKEGGEFSAA